MRARIRARSTLWKVKATSVNQGRNARVGGVVAQRIGEIAAVGDERVEEAEELADARRQGPIGRIGVVGFGRWGRCVEHERH